MEWYVLDLSGSGEGQVEGSCAHGNEPSGSIKCWEVLENFSCTIGRLSRRAELHDLASV
jgi:hypothetical protein